VNTETWEEFIKEAKEDIIKLLTCNKKDAMKFVEKYKLFFRRGEFSVFDAVNEFAWKYGIDISYDKKGNIIITKLAKLASQLASDENVKETLG